MLEKSRAYVPGLGRPATGYPGWIVGVNNACIMSVISTRLKRLIASFPLPNNDSVLASHHTAFP